MVDAYGRWFPDFPGQMAYQDPMYIRTLNQAQQTMQQPSQQQPQGNAQPAQAQITRGELIPVPSEEVARNFYVEPGTSKTFIDNSAPYCYVKSMGFSPLEPPKFERYRLVKEEPQPAQVQPAVAPAPAAPDINLEAFALKSDMDAVRNDMAMLKAQFDSMAAQIFPVAGGVDNG